jgi:uncharacterized membrane protein required for colicin V production
MGLDVAIGLLLLVATYRGWSSGALVMVLSIAVMVLAVLLGVALGRPVGELLSVGPEYAHGAIGFIVVFLVVVICGGFAKRRLKPKAGLLRGVDGLIGAALGLLRSAFLLSVILVMFNLINFPPQSWRDTSRLYSPIVKFSGLLIGSLRDSLPVDLGGEQVEV